MPKLTNGVPRKEERITFRLSAQQRRDLDRIAAKKGQSGAEFVRDLIAEAVKAA
jgi:uncharacterized protein (DUF1778 family)